MVGSGPRCAVKITLGRRFIEEGHISEWRHQTDKQSKREKENKRAIYDGGDL